MSAVNNYFEYVFTSIIKDVEQLQMIFVDYEWLTWVLICPLWIIWIWIKYILLSLPIWLPINMMSNKFRTINVIRRSQNQ